MTFSSRRLRVPALLLVALATVLAFAASAAAEIRKGESTDFHIREPLLPEENLLKGTASYDTSGTMSFSLTTEAPPQAEVGGEPNEVPFSALLLDVPSCTSVELESGAFGALPIAGILSTYGKSTAEGLLVIAGFELPVPAEKTVSGTTTTLFGSSPLIADEGFNCAIIAFRHGLMAFPITAVAEPPAPPAPEPSAPSPPAPSAPAPAPAKLAIARSAPLRLDLGKWKTVKVKVTNAGATTSAAGSLGVKAPKGVKVKRGTQQLPQLAPGTSWTVSVGVELTAKAKRSSTLSITGTAAGSTASSSLVVKAAS